MQVNKSENQDNNPPSLQESHPSHSKYTFGKWMIRIATATMLVTAVVAVATSVFGAAPISFTVLSGIGATALLVGLGGGILIAANSHHKVRDITTFIAHGVVGGFAAVGVIALVALGGLTVLIANFPRF
jgi:hypothetical protein